MTTTPGIKSKPFILYLADHSFNKNDIIFASDMFQVKIMKVYKFN